MVMGGGIGELQFPNLACSLQLQVRIKLNSNTKLWNQTKISHESFFHIFFEITKINRPLLLFKYKSFSFEMWKLNSQFLKSYEVILAYLSRRFHTFISDFIKDGAFHLLTHILLSIVVYKYKKYKYLILPSGSKLRFNKSR